MLPFSDFNEILLSSTIYIAVWTLLHSLVRGYGTFKHAPTVLFVHNCIQVIISLTLLSLAILSLIPSTGSEVLATVQADQALIPRYAYHMSKFYEYLDVFFFVADGGKVDLHFGFHHLTTPYLTYFRVLSGFWGWQVFAGLNALHHTLMYGFFAGAGWTHAILPWTRYIQLVVGVVWDLLIIRAKSAKGEAVAGNWVAVGLLSAYLALLTREIRMRRKIRDGKQN